MENSDFPYLYLRLWIGSRLFIVFSRRSGSVYFVPYWEGRGMRLSFWNMGLILREKWISF